MPIDRSIFTRFLTDADPWSPRRPRSASAANGYRFPARSYPAPLAIPRRQEPPKILLPCLLKTGDARQATNAARPLSEFIQSQQDKLAQRPTKRRRRSLNARSVDTSLWLDRQRYAAWILEGELVAVEDPSPERGTGSPRLRRVTQEEMRMLLRVNWLIPTVIALYPGDSFDKSPTITRYMPHHDLAGALRAALQRALEFEEAVQREVVAQETACNEPAPQPRVTPRKKSRFRPEGNFIIYQPPIPGDDLPDFAIKLLLYGPRAFETRRKAERFITKHAKRGNIPAGCRVARVLAGVKARPVFRDGIKLPKEPEEILKMIRQEPRVVMPELHVEWLPRYRQQEDGSWQLEQHRNKRTVRHQVRHRLVDSLRVASQAMTRHIEDEQVRGSLGQASGSEQSTQVVTDAMSMAFRAERTFPASWKEQLGVQDWELGPDWRGLKEKTHCPTLEENGHWLRAPVEVGTPHVDGLRSRLVELWIDDLARLIEQFGMTLEFWLIKDSTRQTPRWVVPSRT